MAEALPKLFERVLRSLFGPLRDCDAELLLGAACNSNRTGCFGDSVLSASRRLRCSARLRRGYI